MAVPTFASAGRARFAIKSYSVEHGYPSRRRSLLDDAKFETQKRREAQKLRSQDEEALLEDVSTHSARILLARCPPDPERAVHQDRKMVRRNKVEQTEKTTQTKVPLIA
ncbi:hypothetical protein HPB49_004189 [Dermacentor silvarum]|uniref:Uncharacterized protein n=1 Tax=Dermacentor silvarum TaxID=543639 RepID=A0ACB8C229_DERSI|nr:hypothetical protein HPB49_004189 [Dermacentor silvarum]